MRNRRSFLYNSLDTQLDISKEAGSGKVIRTKKGKTFGMANMDDLFELAPRNFESEEDTKESLVISTNLEATPPPVLLTQGAFTMIDEDFGSTVILTQDSQLLLNKEGKDSKFRELGKNPWSMAIWTKRMDEKPIGVKLPWLNHDGSVADAIAGQKWMQWNHWAFVYGRIAAGSLEIYRNGEEIQPNSAGPLPTVRQMPDKMSTLVEVSAEGGLALAHFQLYDTALDPYEVADEMELDRSATSPFLDIAPLQFNLVDSRSFRNVLNIIAQQGKQTFDWEVQNRTPQVLDLKPMANEAPGEDNFHFALEFRPNTFRTTGDLPDLKPVGFPSAATDWRWAVKTKTQRDAQLQVIYWLYTGDGMAIGPNQAMRFRVEYQSAEGPIRSTRVLLQYANVEQGIQPPRRLQGSCLRQLTLTDYVQRTSPLNASIVLSPRVLNDGNTPNELLIRLENTSDHAIGFNHDSFLKLSFVDGSRRDALAAPEFLKQMRLRATMDDLKGPQTDVSIQTDKGVSFTLKLADSGLFRENSLPSRAGFYLQLTNIKTSKPAGLTPIYLSIGNFEGILGNEQVLWVEKTIPLAKRLAELKQVGLGREATTDEILAVGGKLGASSVVADEEITTKNLTAKSAQITEISGLEKLSAGDIVARNSLATLDLKVGNAQIFNGKPGTAFLKFHNSWTARISALNGMAFWANGKESEDEKPAMTIHPNHLVSMGNNHGNPRGLLTLDGYNSTELENHFFFARRENKAYTESFKGKTTVNTSLYATDRIIGAEFNIPSDARTKIVLGKSDSPQDLDTLMGIQITDYRMKDPRKGEATHKKVIAQQVAEIYPQAVTAMTDFVPDIFLNAKMVDGFVWLDIPIHIGDKLKLITPSEEKMVAVISTIEGKGFSVNWEYSGEVFVFGREVDDFQMVDYDALSMLNVSATQELNRKIEKLEAENAQLKAQQAEMANRLQALENLMQSWANPITIEA